MLEKDCFLKKHFRVIVKIVFGRRGNFGEEFKNNKMEKNIYKNTGIRMLVIQEICSLAEKYNVNKVILFGSRARGDFRELSDIDLASSGGDFVRFSLDVDELTSTLLEYDIINLEGAVQKELLDSINKEGVVLYEKI